MAIRKIQLILFLALLLGWHKVCAQAHLKGEYSVVTDSAEFTVRLAEGNGDSIFTSIEVKNLASTCLYLEASILELEPGKIARGKHKGKMGLSVSNVRILPYPFAQLPDSIPLISLQKNQTVRIDSTSPQKVYNIEMDIFYFRPLKNKRSNYNCGKGTYWFDTKMDDYLEQKNVILKAGDL